MKLRRCWIGLSLLLLAAFPPALGAEGGAAGILLRAGVGLDVIDIGLAAGIGGGYRFQIPWGTMEATLDVYYSPYWEHYTAGINEFDYSETLVIVAARANWLFKYAPDSKGLYFLAGTGFFAGSFSWENYNITTDYTEGNSYFASGAVLNMGLGYAFARHWEARLEVPVLLFFGNYEGVIAVAIPITLGFLYRF